MWLEYFEQYLDRVFPRFLSEKPWNYKDDLCMVGAEDLYCATGSESSTVNQSLPRSQRCSAS